MFMGCFKIQAKADGNLEIRKKKEAFLGAPYCRLLGMLKFLWLWKTQWAENLLIVIILKDTALGTGTRNVSETRNPWRIFRKKSLPSSHATFLTLWLFNGTGQKKIFKTEFCLKCYFNQIILCVYMCVSMYVCKMKYRWIFLLQVPRRNFE